MGLDAVAAKRIVYVVDASGSMLLHLSSVLEELERSLDNCIRNKNLASSSFNKTMPLHVPPKGRLLVFASGQTTLQIAMEWMNTSGQGDSIWWSNPMAAIKMAMKLKPDVMYLLSENITGAGRYAVPVRRLLDSLE